MKQIPKVEKYMTPMPYTIKPEATVKDAMSLMREHNLRHLPVVRGDALVGILTDRHIKIASSFQGPGELMIDDVMTENPYCAVPQAPLDEVVFEMAEHKYGCAVVRQENGKVVGIFTATDGLRVLGEILRERFKPGHEQSA